MKIRQGGGKINIGMGKACTRVVLSSDRRIDRIHRTPPKINGIRYSEPALEWFYPVMEEWAGYTVVTKYIITKKENAQHRCAGAFLCIS